MDLWLRNGRLHLTAEVYERQLHSCAAVALLARERDWLLFPLLSGAGGLTVKLRNPRGDRVIESQEFFRAQGIEDSIQARPLRLLPAPEQAAFVISPAD